MSWTTSGTFAMWVSFSRSGRPTPCCWSKPKICSRPRICRPARRAVRAVERLPYVAAVDWIGKTPVVNSFGLADPLFPRDDDPPGRLAAMKERALEHPLAAGQQISEDGKALLVRIRYDWLDVGGDDDAAARVIREAQQAADQQPHALTLGLTGRAPLFLAQHTALKRNQLRFQIIGYALSFVTGAFLFRGVIPVLIVACAPCLGVFWTIGLLRLFGQETNPLTDAILPVLLSMVGMSDGIHLMMHIRQGRAQGRDPIDAAATSIREVGLACALTSLTTAIGFGSLLVAHSEFVRSFGRSCAIGVMITFFAVIFVIPLFSSTRWGWKLAAQSDHDLIGNQLRRFQRPFDWVLEHAPAVALFAVVLTGALTWVAFRLRPDDRLAYGIPGSSTAYQTLAECDRRFGGIEPVRLVVQWDASVPEDSPRILEAVQDAEALLRQARDFGRPLSIADVLAVFPGDPHDPAGHMRFLDLLPLELRDAFYDREGRRTIINTRVQDLGIARYQPVFRDLRGQLDQLMLKHPDMQFRLTGDAVIRGKRLYQIVIDLTNSLGTAAVIILLVVGLAYRSLRIGLAAMIPNLFPLVVTAALLVWTGHALEIASVCAFTVCLGIAVDDTIHFLTRLEQERRAGAPLKEALHQTFVGVGSALITTTLILVLGFATVMTSDLPSHRTFAGMACATIAAALIGDLVFLPAMLMCLPPKKPADIRR